MSAVDYRNIKNFLHVKDFYNWIKDKSGDNSPTSFYWFSVYFTEEKSIIAFNDSFFKNKVAELIDLRFSIQNMVLPHINFSGYNAQGQNDSSGGTLDASNMFGTYTVLGNSYLGLESKTISMKILNTYHPIIERFIYPWMMECLEQKNKQAPTPFPRLNMIIKFWKPNNIFQDSMENVKPDFVYYVTGLFPIKIQAYNPNHTSNADNNRDVTFAFNQFIMIGNDEVARKFNIQEIYKGDYRENTSNWNKIIDQMLANVASAVTAKALDKYLNKPDDKIFNKSEYESVTSNNNYVPSKNINFQSNNSPSLINKITNVQKNDFNGTNNIKSIKSLNTFNNNNFSGLEVPNNSSKLSNLNINSISGFQANQINSADINDDNLKRSLDQILSKLKDSDENFEEIVIADNEFKNSEMANNFSNTINSANSIGESNPEFNGMDVINSFNSIGESNPDFNSNEPINYIDTIGENNPDFGGMEIENSANSIGQSNPDFGGMEIENSANSIGQSNPDLDSNKPINYIDSIGESNQDFGGISKEKSVNSIGKSNLELSGINVINSKKSIGQSNPELDSNKPINSANSIGESNPDFNSNKPINSVNSIGESNPELSGLSKEKSVNSIGQSNLDFNGVNVINSANSIGESNPELSGINVINSKKSIGQSNPDFGGMEIENSANSIGQSNPELNSNKPINSANSIGESNPDFNGVNVINSKKSIGQSNPELSGLSKEKFIGSIGQSNPDFNSNKPINYIDSIGQSNPELSGLSKEKSVNSIGQSNPDFSVDDEKIIKTSKNNKKNNDLDEYTSVKNNEERSKVLNLKLINNRILIPTGDVNISPGEVTGIKVEPGTMEDLLTLSLKNNKNITSTSFSYLSDYAKKTNEKVSDVIKKYKSLSGNELNNFIANVLSDHVSKYSLKNELNNDKNNQSDLSEYYSNNEKLSESDLDGLF